MHCWQKEENIYNLNVRIWFSVQIPGKFFFLISLSIFMVSTK